MPKQFPNEIKLRAMDLFLEGNLSNPRLATDHLYLELSSPYYTRISNSAGTSFLDINPLTNDTWFMNSGGESSGSYQFIGGSSLKFGTYTNTQMFVVNIATSSIKLYNDTGNSYTRTQVDDAAGATTINTEDATGSAGHITIHPDGDLKLTPETGIIYMYDQDNADDYAKFTVGTDGDLTLETVDAAATAAHLTLQPDGDLVLDPVSQKTIINATDALYFDGGTHTYIAETSDDTLDIYVGNTRAIRIKEDSTDGIYFEWDTVIEATKKLLFDSAVSGHTYIVESSDDVLDVVVGADTIFQITESGADGNTIDIENACIGFTQLEPTFDLTTTTVDFRHSNKQNLTFGSGNIINLQLIFPLVSGNFQLLIKQDGTGSRTIANYKVYEFDESTADGYNAIKWAGGSAPTLTTDANHVDILSFYWDADNEIAYGVATLDFQF